MGYEAIENREKIEKEIGYIEMDSVFSPVISVGVKAENMRVGKMTNWGRLILDIATDGTISPEEAFNQAVKILIEQYNALLPNGEKISGKDKLLKEDKKEEDKKLDTEIIDTKIQEESEEKKEINDKGSIEEMPKKKRGRPRKTDN